MNVQTRGEVSVAIPLIMWSATGDLACAKHAPIPGSGAWVSRQWRAMSESDIEVFKRENEHLPACSTCAAIKRPIARRGRGHAWCAVPTSAGWEIRDQDGLLVAVVPDPLHSREADAQLIAKAPVASVPQSDDLCRETRLQPI